MFQHRCLLALILLIFPLSSIGYPCANVITNKSHAVWSIQYQYPRSFLARSAPLPEIFQAGWHEIQPGQTIPVDYNQFGAWAEGELFLKDIKNTQVQYHYDMSGRGQCPHIYHADKTENVSLNEPVDGNILIVGDNWQSN